MPLFTVSKTTLQPVAQLKFTSRGSEQLVEENLDTVFKCRLVASEFSTGAQHAGRIDTLGLSGERTGPVVRVGTKYVQSSDLVNQQTFYLSWIQDTVATSKSPRKKCWAQGQQSTGPTFELSALLQTIESTIFMRSA